MGNNKKTIGIVSFYKDNYGAFLQAYSLQQKLKSLGFNAEMIDYDDFYDNAILGIPLNLFKRDKRAFLKRLIVEIIFYKAHSARRKVFKKSVMEHISESLTKYNRQAQLFKNPPVYDIYLSGSDQVLNPQLQPQSFDSRLLKFTKGTKITYAASAGDIGFIEGNTDIIHELRSFKGVSVREDSLRDYLYENGINAIRHIDPTLLLTKEDWEHVCKKPFEISEPYIFYYRVLPQKELEIVAEKLSEELQMPIFTGDGRATFKNQINRARTLSPMEWVGALMNADYVVTNSFHGSAFSINFQKKAYIKLPPHGGARIEDLVNKTGTHRLYDYTPIKNHEVKSIYSHADDYLSIERSRSLEYLYSIHSI